MTHILNRILFVLILVSLVAGCTGGNSFDKNAGAVIKEYSIDFSDLEEKEETGIILSVQDVGGKTMPGDSKLWLYGPAFSDSAWEISGSISAAAGDTGLVIETNSFLPPDEDRGGEGEIRYTEGILTYKGDIPEGLPPQDFTFKARLCYPYITSATSALKAQSRNEYRVNIQKKTKAQTIESAGPIHISLRGNENIRFSGNKLQLQFDVANVGKGYPLAKSDSDCEVGPDLPVSALNKVNMSVTVDGAEVCVSKIVKIDKQTNKGLMYCTATISDAYAKDPEHEYYITATAKYDYYVTEQLIVSVSDSEGYTVDSEEDPVPAVPKEE